MNRRFFAPPENFNRPTVRLSSDETRHLRDVLRLRPTDKVQVFDGQGREFFCEIEVVGKKEAGLKIIAEISPPASESNLDLTLAVALLKGDKFELVIQKAVELGVKRFVPLLTRRTDVKIKDAAKKLERWRKIVPEASKQCGRARLMTIEAPVDFERFMIDIRTEATDETAFVLFAERGGDQLSKLRAAARLTAVIGPEGGWDEAEIELARRRNGQLITFGGRILRAETAVIVISALLQNRFGDLR